MAVGADDHARWFGRFRLRRRRAWIALDVAGLVAVATVGLIVWPGSDVTSPVATDAAPEQVPVTIGAADVDAAVPGSMSTHGSEPVGAALASISTLHPGPAEPATVSTTPAQLEDVVRTAAQHPVPSTDVAREPASDPDSLASALLTDLDGFERIDEPDADRHLDLTAASELQPDPTEEVALLETRRFAGGWTRAFINGANDVAVLSVYQFGDPGQAEFYLEDGLITIGGYGGSFFDIESLPGVRGFHQSLVDDGEELISLGAAFHVGPRWYLIYVVGDLASVTPEVLVPIVAEQYLVAESMDG